MLLRAIFELIEYAYMSFESVRVICGCKNLRLVFTQAPVSISEQGQLVISFHDLNSRERHEKDEQDELKKHRVKTGLRGQLCVPFLMFGRRAKCKP